MKVGGEGKEEREENGRALRHLLFNKLATAKTDRRKNN